MATFRITRSSSWVLLFVCMIAMVAAMAVTKSEDRKFLGANWKCNLETTQEVDKLADNLNHMWSSLSKTEATSVELCVYPPYVFIDRVRRRLKKEIGVGSQNTYDANGPNLKNTGSTTTGMLKSVGCNWVLLGHSDRRNSLGETDDLIADKVRGALEDGLGVTLTIGETKVQRSAGEAISTLLQQLKIAASKIPADSWGNVVIAYEPVWAIGEGATPCSPEEAQRVNAELRKWIHENVSPEAAQACRLTYTGSVDDSNAVKYAGLDDVDGFVVGRAGLDTVRLKSIITTLAKSAANTEL